MGWYEMISVPKTNLHIGSRADIGITNEQEWAFVHATQTIHYSLMGCDRKYNKPPKDHPNYIVLERDNHLSLNWVDGHASLYEWSGPATFIKILDYIDKWIGKRKVLVHCDQGMSRGPTLGLLYLSKRLKLIPNTSYSSARAEFDKLYESYQPSGIGDYVNEHWAKII